MNIFDKALKEIEINQAYKEFIEGLPQVIQLCSMAAKMEKVYYDELIKEGFTNEEALRIVMEHGIFPGRTDRQKKEEQ